MSGTKPRVRKGTPRVKAAECIFRKGFVTEVIDKKVDDLWKAGFGVAHVPFGDLRNMFRRHHCRTLNPYGDSERCPFDKKECAYAFLQDVQVTVAARPHTPVGYFIKVAKSSGARRADEAVERRAAAAKLRTDVPPAPAAYAHPAPPEATTRPDPGGLGASAADGDDPRPRGRAGVSEERDAVQRSPLPADTQGRLVALPRGSDGPVPVGDVFGSLGLGSRQGRPEDGSEGGG